MRLTDINDFIDAKRVFDRAYDRAFGMRSDGYVYMDSLNQLRELATATDKSMERNDLGEGNVIWRVEYRGVAFEYLATHREEE